MITQRLSILLTVATALVCLPCLASLVGGCSKSDDTTTHDPHSSPYPTCDAIIKACHLVDLGEGKPSECHALGHDAPNDDACVAKKDECLKACAEAAEAGLPGADAGTD